MIGGRQGLLTALLISAEQIRTSELPAHYNCTKNDLRVGINGRLKLRKTALISAAEMTKLRGSSSAGANGVDNDAPRMLRFSWQAMCWRDISEVHVILPFSLLDQCFLDWL